MTKRKKQKTVKGWAVVDKSGEIMKWSVGVNRDHAIERFIGAWRIWTEDKKQGYRCLPVEIKVRTR